MSDDKNHGDAQSPSADAVAPEAGAEAEQIKPSCSNSAEPPTDQQPSGSTNRHSISRKTPVKTAARFVGHFTHDGVPTICHVDGRLWYWNGAVYLPLTNALLTKAIYHFLARCVDSDALPFQATQRDVEAVRHALLAKVKIRDDFIVPCWLDNRSVPSPAQTLVCRNGLLDLSTSKLMEHTPNFFCLDQVDYQFDPNAAAPTRWLQFLNELWGDDDESVLTLQEFFGYCLTSLTMLQKILQLLGPPRSGRSTIIRILVVLLGSSSIVTPTLASMSEPFGLQPLIGKKLAVFSDARLSRRTDTAIISERLLSISGEDVQTVNRKFLSAWVGKLTTRLILVSNELLSLPDSSGALPSRMLVLRTKQSFLGHEDPSLTAELLQELSGILNWSIRGLHRLLDRGHFIQPASALSMVTTMHEIASPTGTFVKERCDVGVNRSVEADTLYKGYCQWCVASDHESLSKPSFGRDLHSVVPTLDVKQRRGRDGKRRRFYVGIALKAEFVTGGTRDSILRVIENDDENEGKGSGEKKK